jgi:hypothetical protein
MTTATKLTPAETRDRLQELLKVATEYAAAELRMNRLAVELKQHEDEWTDDLEQFESAVNGEIMAALSWGEDDRDGPTICQDIQDAIDVLKFAIERSDDAR